MDDMTPAVPEPPSSSPQSLECAQARGSSVPNGVALPRKICPLPPQDTEGRIVRDLPSAASRHKLPCAERARGSRRR